MTDTRRDFLKTALLGFGATVLASTVSTGRSQAEVARDMDLNDIIWHVDPHDTPFLQLGRKHDTTIHQWIYEPLGPAA